MEYIGQLKHNYSNDLKGFAVHEFSSNKYLTMTKNDSVILEVADIGQVDMPTLHINFTICINKIIILFVPQLKHRSKYCRYVYHV